jgi:hypothetical protein
MIRISSKNILLLCGGIWLTTTAGCGTSTYGEKFSKRLAELELSSPFAVLRAPTTDLPVNFRIPVVMKDGYDRNSAMPGDSKQKIRQDLIAPLFMMDFPGLRMMYQGDMTSKQFERLPIYCYLGEGDAVSVKGKFPYDTWLARVKNKFPNTKAWESIDVPTPLGKKLSWKRLVAKGKQEFEIVESNKARPSTMDGAFQLWVYETPQWISILGWRAPTEAAESFHLDDLAKLTAGTAVVNPSYVDPFAKKKDGKDKAGAARSPAGSLPAK